MNGATSVTSVTRFTRCGSRAGGLLSLLSRCPRVRKERGRAFSIFFCVRPHTRPKRDRSDKRPSDLRFARNWRHSRLPRPPLGAVKRSSPRRGRRAGAVERGELRLVNERATVPPPQGLRGSLAH
jgi:hypothetical protein